MAVSREVPMEDSATFERHLDTVRSIAKDRRLMPDGAATTSGDRELLSELLTGLRRPQKSIPPKLLYDERGSELFERICELDEYYLTRTELAIMEAHVKEMAERVGPDGLLIEYGSGSGLKTRLLLERLERPVAYVPIEISGEALRASVAALADAQPHLTVLPLCADYTRPVEIPATEREPATRVAYFPGSTIGNFEPPQARAFLERTARAVGPGGGLLVGVDLHKDRAILERAYDDSAGVTAEFELNVLHRLNREFDADLRPDRFRYHSFYDEERRRVEMSLVSLERQSARVGGVEIAFDEGERVVTEYSYKFTPDGFSELAERAGFSVERVWTDPREWFSVQYLSVD
jgi:dimethylhistidine N-methyltransferase